MAAPVDRGEVRVRLLFEYPPPALPQSRHLWFMLDTGQCRAITDVTAIIRERFFYSHGGALSLYLDGCLLPPGESVRLIRDNDAISVRWEDSRAHDGPHQATKKMVEDESDDCKYPQKTRGGYRAAPETWREEERSKRMKKKREVTPEEEVSKWPKKRRRRKMTSEDEEVSEQPEKETEDVEEAGKKLKKKKKKKETEDEEEAGKKPKKKKKETEDEEEAGKKPKKKKKVTEEEEEAGKKLKKKETEDEEEAGKKPKKKETEDEEEAGKKPKKKKEETEEEEEAGKKTKKKKKEDEEEAGKKTKKKEVPVPEGSESGLSVEGSEKKSREKRTKKSPYVVPSQKAPPPNSTYRKAESSSSCNTEDRGGQGRGVEPGPPLRMQQSAGPSILTTSPPVCNGHVAQHRPPLVTAGRGAERGRGLDIQPPRGRGFRGRGEELPHNHFFYNYSPEARKQQQLNEDVSHVSVVVQNPPEVPIKDYSALPLLAAPPQPGNVLAFKLLELTENYTPEISDYKEGRVLSYNPVSQQLEVEILSQQKWKEPGKFDLVYELEDGTDIVEYAVPQECKISQAWSSLIEPRLVTGLTAVVTPGP